MSQIENLKKYITSNNLIKDISDIDFLFSSYEYDSSRSLEELINNVIEWGFNNDELEDFYSEHWDELLDSDILTLIKSCELSDPPYSTTFDLYKYNSKNIYFYKVESSGLYSDCFDDTDCFHIMKNENDALVIDLFKAKCEDIYTLDGDLDDDELEGHEITFTE